MRDTIPRHVRRAPGRDPPRPARRRRRHPDFNLLPGPGERGHWRSIRRRCARGRGAGRIRQGRLPGRRAAGHRWAAHAPVEWSDWRNGPVYWLQSVYVAPRPRQRRLPPAPLWEALETARGAGARAVRLYGRRGQQRRAGGLPARRHEALALQTSSWSRCDRPRRNDMRRRRPWARSRSLSGAAAVIAAALLAGTRRQPPAEPTAPPAAAPAAAVPCMPRVPPPRRPAARPGRCVPGSSSSTASTGTETGAPYDVLQHTVFHTRPASAPSPSRPTAAR